MQPPIFVGTCGPVWDRSGRIPELKLKRTNRGTCGDKVLYTRTGFEGFYSLWLETWATGFLVAVHVAYSFTTVFLGDLVYPSCAEVGGRNAPLSLRCTVKAYGLVLVCVGDCTGWVAPFLSWLAVPGCLRWRDATRALRDLRNGPPRVALSVAGRRPGYKGFDVG